MYVKITVHVQGLCALGVDSKQYGSMLITVLISKVPNDVKLRIACKN